MPSINKVVLTGRLITDIKAYMIDGDTLLTSFLLATKETFFKNGNFSTRTEIHSVMMRSSTTEPVSELKKGTFVYLAGEAMTYYFVDEQGLERFDTEINVRNLKILNGDQGV